MLLRIILLSTLLGSSLELIGQTKVQKGNPMRVYMHYMPWYETPETSENGSWGWHWTMNAMDPEEWVSDDKRQIASHYYPLIGPYASSDKDVLEYHFLLMKLAGIDGVLVNWYGEKGGNGDISELLRNSNAIVESLEQYGMEFGVIMEDRFSRSIDDAKANVAYLDKHYFSKPHYIQHDNRNLLGIFGPITFEQPEQWSEILGPVQEGVEFLTLWHESSDAGNTAGGEFLWIYQDDKSHTDHLKEYYAGKAQEMETVMGVAYPGFKDFYQEGKAGEGYFHIPHQDGKVLRETLAMALSHQDKLDMIQLATWNDFGEGTMIEPTLETRFEYLKILQEFTQVSFGENELELVHQLYLSRKEHACDEQIQQDLDQVAHHLINLDIAAAEKLLNKVRGI